MNRAWLWILVGGCLETTWAMGMKMSDGFTDLPWTVFTGVFLVLSVVSLNQGLKSGLPTGICYAAWVGIGAVGSIVVGLLVLGETLNILGWMFLGVVLVGIIGLNYFSESDREASDDLS